MFNWFRKQPMQVIYLNVNQQKSIHGVKYGHISLKHMSTKCNPDYTQTVDVSFTATSKEALLGFEVNINKYIKDHFYTDRVSTIFDGRDGSLRLDLTIYTKDTGPSRDNTIGSLFNFYLEYNKLN